MRKIEATKGSGNVFEDIGLKHPEVELLRAQLALEIFKILEERKLTQTQAAKILGVDQPEISKLKNGDFSRFRVERLFLFLNRLGQNVDIRISRAKRQPPHQRVKAA